MALTGLRSDWIIYRGGETLGPISVVQVLLIPLIVLLPRDNYLP